MKAQTYLDVMRAIEHINSITLSAQHGRDKDKLAETGPMLAVLTEIEHTARAAREVVEFDAKPGFVSRVVGMLAR